MRWGYEVTPVQLLTLNHLLTPYASLLPAVLRVFQANSNKAVQRFCTCLGVQPNALAISLSVRAVLQKQLLYFVVVLMRLKLLVFMAVLKNMKISESKYSRSLLL